MPGKHVAHTPHAPPESCRRCKVHPSVLVVRSEPLCQECFTRYIHTKCIKRLESFRVNFANPEQRRTVLLPLSFGVSSVTLLHILHLHLETQKTKTGRTGFAIHGLHVWGPERDPDAKELLQRTRQQYPDYQFTSLPLHDLFKLLPEDAAIRALVPPHHPSTSSSPEDQLAHVINALPSATARADVLTTLRTRLIVEHARLSSCDSILWGDSTTKLAEKTLAETAKGRGFSLPWQVSDRPSPFGVLLHYPLRDILRKELVSYITMSDPALPSLVHKSSSQPTPTAISSKHTTIDDLMMQYFESVEETFPNIVSNVVRTTSKLELPNGADTAPYCKICSMPVVGARFGIHDWGGDQHDGNTSASLHGTDNICYGCTRSMPKPTTETTSR